MIRHQYSRLCCLIHNSLHPFKAKSTVSMTKEREKSLLITLSQVLNQIKLWIGEFDSESDSGDHDNPLIPISGNTVSTIHVPICHSSPSECIVNITNDLLSLLVVQSPYARHLAGNVLVAISEFIASSESYWEEFIQSLCFHFELTIHEVISPSSNPPKTKHLDHNSSTLKLDLQSVSSDTRLCSASVIVLVLRNILKQLKHEEDDEILNVYMNALSSCFRDIPWELFNGIFIDKGSGKSWFEFCGHLLQLFCSVVSQSSLPETMADSEDKNPVYREIFNIFPKLLTWGLDKEGDDRGYMCISGYIRHKILVLMIRLSSLIKLDCEMLVSWLHLIDKHFQDLLHESLTQPNTNQDNCLKDSPFLMFPDNKEKETCHRHLQRRAVFLYLKCGLHLINLKGKSMNQCVCGDVKSCSKKGFIAIHEWLKKHLPTDIEFNRCKQYAKSFVQLYIHEDDMLFKVLLLVTDMPNMITKNCTFEVVEKDILVLMLDIFNPVNLFHIFLSEIHYDHEVILDYLISKDTGAICAEYLLRCLRIICDKWNAFLTFSFHEELGSQFSNKRRKVIEPDLSLETDPKNQKTCKESFDDARDCLLLLKRSVENLHQKDLFPYNPKVLLRHLTRFQELCARP